MESGIVSPKPTRQTSWITTLQLAFQTIGVIYGDMGTSPLYVFDGIFGDRRIGHRDDILGVLSLIIYTIILLPMIKYVFIVLKANNNGDGGTFALYSLICRYANVGFIPNDRVEDTLPSDNLHRPDKIKQKLENSRTAKIVLFLFTILGTAMVIGDGVLTPCISVLSAVSGINTKHLNQDGVVYVSIAILILLFLVQRYGTHKIGYLFAPVISIWFLFICGIGAYNLFKYDVSVLRAFNPIYIFYYFKRNGKEGWISLGGVVLCMTGTEAMFADLGHFNVPAVQISFSLIVFPALLTAYIGQAAYLTKFPSHIGHTFYSSTPGPLYWPTFALAIAAAIVASQAMISGAFAIVSQSLSLRCFPRVKIVHTSPKHEGQVYIPEINYLLMLACVIVTFEFRTTEKIGNAYGIAVVVVMMITTCLVTLIMLIIWKTKMWWTCSFFMVFISIELVFLSSVLHKFGQGGYLPLAFSLVLMMVMGTWHYAQQQRYMFELRNKVSSDYIRDLANNYNIKRIPGIGLLYSELVEGIPPIFPRFISHISSIHSVLVFVSVQPIPISKVAVEERFLFRYVEPREYRLFRCVVRYGYNDLIEETDEFERQFLETLKEFIRHEHFMMEQIVSVVPSEQIEAFDAEEPQEQIEALESYPSATSMEESPEQLQHESIETDSSVASMEQQQQIEPRISNASSIIQSADSSHVAEEELEFLERAKHEGIYYLAAEAELVARKESSFLKQLVINYAYSFLRKNFREGENVLAIPKNRLLKLGMYYEIL